MHQIPSFRKTLSRFFRRSAVAFLLAALVSSSASAQSLPIPPGDIDLRSIEGQSLLLKSESKAAFFPLVSQFVTQKLQSYCGVASLTMVVNALNIPAPAAPEFGSYRIFTQDNLFDGLPDDVRHPDWIVGHGLTLDELGALARRFSPNSIVIHAEPGGESAFRDVAAQALATPGRYVVVNFLRAALHQEGYGHFSPLAAFDADSDRFLLLDVARFKYPPLWIKTSDLYAAMSTTDPAAQAWRGYLIIDSP